MYYIHMDVLCVQTQSNLSITNCSGPLKRFNMHAYQGSLPIEHIGVHTKVYVCLCYTREFMVSSRTHYREVQLLCMDMYVRMYTSKVPIQCIHTFLMLSSSVSYLSSFDL